MNSMSFAPARPLAAPAALFHGLWRTAQATADRLLLSRPRLVVARSTQRANEAAEVRRLAMQMMHIDPGMAGDLMAAADRHQGESA